jgi:hypothetical protein
MLDDNKKRRKAMTDYNPGSIFQNIKRLAFCILFLLIMFLIIPCMSSATGTVTSTCVKVETTEAPSDMYTLTYTWIADGSGNASAATSAATSLQIAGKNIIMVVTDPGSPAPTADYDITITDANGVDVMGGSLANRHTTNTEQALPYIGTAYGPRPVSGALTLNVSSAGAAGAGTVIIYLSR